MTESAIRLHVEQVEPGVFVATSPDVPGLVAQGRTVSEVVEIARDVARRIAEDCLEHNDPVREALLRDITASRLELLVPVGLS